MLTPDECQEIEAILRDYQRGVIYTQTAADRIAGVLRRPGASHDAAAIKDNLRDYLIQGRGGADLVYASGGGGSGGASGSFGGAGGSFNAVPGRLETEQARDGRIIARWVPDDEPDESPKVDPQAPGQWAWSAPINPSKMQTTCSLTVECVRVRETDEAVLLEIEPGVEVWIPLSQVESMHFDGRGNGKIEITDWIARKKGLL